MNKANTLMIQGTGSSVGKSIMVAALCRIFKQDGIHVAPFKSQNMALNSFVTKHGGEMGRAQVVQAEAAGIEPTVDMNPILIKPEADTKAQVIVLGKPNLTLRAGEYYHYAPELISVIENSLNQLRSSYELVIIEGAGSPAEVNLKEREIVNMRVAKMAQAPVLLVGDIDKGGVFASLVGTLALLDQEEREYIKGFIINKFRGDIELLRPGLDYLENHTSKPVIGVVPYYHGIVIPEEDSILNTDDSRNRGLTDIAIIHLPHISNSTDFEPLQQQEGVRVRYITSPDELDNPHAIIIPGTKSVIADLALLRQSGLADAITQRAEDGTAIIGICGGFQMMGQKIYDPSHIESQEDAAEGLGLLDVITIFQQDKTTYQSTARVACDRGLFQGMNGQEVTGYEIHSGQTVGKYVAAPFRIIARGDKQQNFPDGAVDETGKIFGTYLHGLFDNDKFCHTLLSNLNHGSAPSRPQRITPSREQHYNELADLVRRSLDMKLIYQICGLSQA